MVKVTDVDEKTGKKVFDVLKYKCPAAVESLMEELEDYDICPDILDLDIMSDTELEVAAKLSGA